MRVAIATQNLTRIDAHLGASRHLMSYDASAEGITHLRTASFRTGLVRDGDHDKLVLRLKALKGCSVVFVADVGLDGERGLVRQRIAPLRQFAGQPIATALEALVDGMRRNSSLWLRRAEQQERRRSVRG